MKHSLPSLLGAILISAVLCSCGGGRGDAVAAEEGYYDRMMHCKEQIEAVVDFEPDVVVVMGSGFQDLVDGFEIVATIPYDDIDGWPSAAAPGHKGNLIFARRGDVDIAFLQGRPHYFDGSTGPEIVLPLRVMHLLGADAAIFVSAVGAINPDYAVGDFVCVEDHISTFIPSPLTGENIDELGSRYVDMTHAYDQGMRDVVLSVSAENGITMHSGVYLQVTGPQYETPAEIDMFRTLGADTVSMSDVAEALAARHMGMRVCSINYVSNMGAGMEEKEISHELVVRNSKDADDQLAIVLEALLDYVGETNE